MTGTEWFLLIVVVILLPLLVAVAVTLWTLEMARQRNKRNQRDRPVGRKRRAVRVAPRSPGRDDDAAAVETGDGGSTSH